MAWAAKTGVVTGVSENAFAPGSSISREQLVTMLYRYAKLLHLDTSVSAGALDAYTDAGQVDSWAGDAMAWCVENGIVYGVDAGTLAPNGTAARAQAALILERWP